MKTREIDTKEIIIFLKNVLKTIELELGVKQ